MLAGSASARAAEVTGKLGYLSEWELTGHVTERVSGGKAEFAGPVTVKHVGLCTPGRPVEMVGEIHYRVTGLLTRRLEATLVLDGTECGFEGKLAGSYDGVLTCSQWRGIPVSLIVKPSE